MRLELSEFRHVPVIQVHGRLLGGLDHYERFDETLDRALADEPSRLVIDLSDCRYVQSPGVGMIMAAQTSMADRHGRLGVVVSTQPIRKLFDLLQLNQVIDIYESLDQAVDSGGGAAKD